MKELAAYLLLKLGGKDSPSKAEIEAALSSVGVEMDGGACDKLLGDLEGKDLNQLIAEGKKSLCEFGGGGGGGGGGAAAVAGGADAAPEAAKEEEEEEEAPAAVDMFGGGDAGGGGGDY